MAGNQFVYTDNNIDEIASEHHCSHQTVSEKTTRQRHSHVMAEGWICIARKITDWEWYSDPNVFRLFMHLLLKANFRANNWQGTVVERGQLITSRGKISEKTGLSIKQIRLAETKLKSTNTIALIGANKFTHYTIVNYDDYQVDNGDEATKGQSKGDQRAIKGQHLNKDNKDNNITLPPTPLPDWLPLPEWSAFREMRKKAKTPMGEAAENIAIATLNRLRADGHDPKAVLEQSIMSGWKGLFPIKASTQSKGSQYGARTKFTEQDYSAGTEGFIVVGGGHAGA